MLPFFGTTAYFGTTVVRRWAAARAAGTRQVRARDRASPDPGRTERRERRPRGAGAPSQTIVLALSSARHAP